MPGRRRGQYYKQRRRDSRFILRAFLFIPMWLVFYLCYFIYKLQQDVLLPFIENELAR